MENKEARGHDKSWNYVEADNRGVAELMNSVEKKALKRIIVGLCPS